MTWGFDFLYLHRVISGYAINERDDSYCFTFDDAMLEIQVLQLADDNAKQMRF